MTRWGVVSTIRADADTILNFAAWHLDLGAHRLFLHLDEDAPDARAALEAHPRIRVRVCDDAWWNGRRPAKHQVRQTRNATRSARRRTDVDWLAHIDVDEFLLPGARTVAGALAALPATALCARVRPMEALAPTDGAAPEDVAFKALPDDPASRVALAQAIFPTWGAVLPGGFLSHMQGKLFLRTGLQGVEFRIHNAYLDGDENPGESALPDIALGHFHAAERARFLAAYRYRLSHGSYRAELKPPRRDGGAPNLHDLFREIEARDGEPGLHAFFDEMCLATPDLCGRLAAHSLLRRHRMDLAAARARHFPAA